MTKEEAITILRDCELNPCVPKDKEAVDMAIKALEQEPKLKIGHWNRYTLRRGGLDEEWLGCSECMWSWSNVLMIPKNYCPNCGAKMEKESEG